MPKQVSRMTKLIPYLQTLEDELKKPLNIVETGCIRQITHKSNISDGHSTEHICEFVKNSEYPHAFVSIDIDTSVCQEYLTEKKLIDYVHFIQGDSLSALHFINSGLDFVLLDTANNADQIFKEYMLIKNKLMPHSIVCIDDANLDEPTWKKGDKIIPYMMERGYNLEMIEDRVAVLRRLKTI